jgi:tRNA modification GTPase
MIYDTIAAVITAPGKAAVGIVRLSGPDAFGIADQIFCGKKGVSVRDQRNYTLAYGHVAEEGHVIDEALMIKMQSPHSFTGEDVVEIQVHGGTVVLNHILKAVLRKGARMAEPGEFSKRAFLHGKMDLIQAEAMADLIQADHALLAEAAAEQMTGSLTDTIRGMSDRVLDWAALLEALVDYPDEELDGDAEFQWREAFLAMRSEMDELLLTMDQGKMIRQGLRVVLAGKPNVGKSTLMNALLDDDRAIVTDIPGTTRDTLEEGVLIKGVPVVLTDTAGLAETDEPVEKIGVERSRRAMAEADVVLYVLEVNGELDGGTLREIQNLDPQGVLILVNKTDLEADPKWEHAFGSLLSKWRPLRVSAKEKTGLDQLTQCLRERFLAGTQAETQREGALPRLINTRHGAALEKARDALIHAMTALEEGVPLDMISIDLRQAWVSLGEITGSVSDEDLIDRIFSKFCLGK